MRSRHDAGTKTAARVRRGLSAFVALALCAAMTTAAVPAYAQQRFGEAPAMESLLASKLQKRGDLTLRSTSLPDALFTISQLWGINLVVGQEVQGQVNGVFQDAPLNEILDAILLSNGYSYRPVGQSLVVLPMAELGEVNPLFETATIPVRSADPKDIVEGVRLLSSPKGRIQAIPSARSLLVLDFPDRVAMIRTAVRALEGTAPAGDAALSDDRQLQAAYLAPQFVDAAVVKEALAAVLSSDGKIAVVVPENRLVVVDYPRHLRLAHDVLKRLDRVRRQVRITAYIYDLSLADVERIGINWNHALKGRNNSAGDPQSSWAIDSLTQIPIADGAVGGAMTFMNLSQNFDLQAVVNLLSEADDSRLLADPNIMVVDNENAEIAIVSEIPFQQLTQTSAGGNIGTTAFREAGVKLKVKPRVAADGTILLDVEPEFSRLTGFTPEDNQPIIDRRTAKTIVRIADGHTLVIGGLRQRADVGHFSGIPYLKDIPHLGFLFRSRDTTVRESELIVFLKPQIVTVSDPPLPRQAASLDTTRGYLGAIPIAEGCPIITYDGAVEELPPVEQHGDDAGVLRESAPLETSDPLGVKIQRLPRIEATQVQYQLEMVPLPAPVAPQARPSPDTNRTRWLNNAYRAQ